MTLNIKIFIPNLTIFPFFFSFFLLFSSFLFPFPFPFPFSPFLLPFSFSPCFIFFFFFSNSRQKKSKETCEGTHEEYIENENRKFSNSDKVSEHNHHRYHEPFTKSTRMRCGRKKFDLTNKVQSRH